MRRGGSEVGTRPGRGRAAFTGWEPVHNPDWRDEALCSGRDAEVFFPEEGQSAIVAKGICRRCPVRADCLAHAVQHRERYGIWGGFTEHARALLVNRLIDATVQASAAGGDDGPVAA